MFLNRSYYVGDSRIQRIFGKEAFAKRPKKDLHGKVLSILAVPDAQMLLLPPPPKQIEPEMMDLVPQNEE